MNFEKSFLEKNTIYETILGSTAYGLSKEGSDIDKKSIVVLPLKETLTLSKEWETSTFHEPDIEFHSLKKLILLANTQNPTILEMLAVDDCFVTKNTKWSKQIRENFSLFLSQNCYHSFGGYARQQLYKIKAGLNKLTFEDEKNHLLEKINNLLVSFEERYSLVKGEIKLNNIYLGQDDKIEFNLNVNKSNVNIRHLTGMVNELNNLQKSYSKVNSRNRKTKEKLGKHAMHLIRLLKMGIEVLREGELKVYRLKDREFLLDIRNEKYSWDEIFDIIDELNEQLNEALKHTILPKQTNFEKINVLYQEILFDFLKIN